MLTESQVFECVSEAFRDLKLDGKRVMLIVPDSTRTAPVGQMFRLIFHRIGGSVARLDVMVALGTHPSMSEEAICARLEISEAERAGRFAGVGFLNHRWDDPGSLTKIGSLSAETISEISLGAFSMEVEVTINRAILDYDHLLILGPVFPHEVAGFSGGAKYLFPGVSGPELLNFFHWLGALNTNYETIGRKLTPVREVIHRAAALVPTPCHAFCMVVQDGGLAGLFFGTPPGAWSQAADLSEKLHIIHTGRLYHSVLSCAPKMYGDLWVGGKCMYKLEPVMAPGGELIIYAPHIREVSVTHGADIERTGYHVAEYFQRQWDRFKDEPWSVLAHSTHVKGRGSYRDGVETPTVNVTLATGIPRKVCEKINLGYRDPLSIDFRDYMGKEDEGVLFVEKAGEILYRPD